MVESRLFELVSVVLYIVLGVNFRMLWRYGDPDQASWFAINLLSFIGSSVIMFSVYMPRLIVWLGGS